VILYTDMTSAKLLRRINDAHSDDVKVWSVAWTNNGRVLASCASDNSIKLWKNDTETDENRDNIDEISKQLIAVIRMKSSVR